MALMRDRKRFITLAVLLAVVVIIVVASLRKGRLPTTSIQTGKVVRKQKLYAKVNASGEIKPKEYVELQAEISGVITQLFVEEGDFVEKGGLLVKIDPTQTEAETRAQEALLQAALMEANNQQAQIGLQQTNLRREEASVRVAEAEIRRSQQALTVAENNFKRKQELFEENLISRDLYEVAKNELVAAQSALTTAEAREEQARASLAVAEVVLLQARNSYDGALSRVDQNRALLVRTRNSLSKTIIRSPLTGVITQLHVEVGERAVPGTLNNPAATIMVIADLSVIEAEIEVDETDIVNVRLGQEAEVHVDALPDQPLQGEVTEIGNSAIERGDTQEAKDFKVAIRLLEPPPALRPGLSCTADITTALRENVLALPIQALTVREYKVDDRGEIIRPGLEEGNESDTDGEPDDAELKDFQGVFVVREGKVEFIPVTIGITGATDIEIEAGLDEGFEIVTGSYKALRELADGDRVEVVNRDRG